MNHLRRDIQDFLNGSHKKAASTRRQYGWQLSALAKWGEGQTPPLTETNQFTARELNRYIAERRDSGVSEAFLKVAVNALKSYFAYAAQQRWITDDPAGLMEVPKVHRKSQRTPSFDDIEAVLALCETTKATGLRNLALITLMGSTGLRASEVCRLTLAQVDVAKRSFYVVIKGGDEKRGRFSESVARIQFQWLAVRPTVARPDCRTFFCSTNPSAKGTGLGEALSPDGLRTIFRRLAERAGLTQGFSPHDMRRFLATRSIELGAPSRMAQVAGRWERIEMVEHYSQALGLERFDNYDPIEHVLKGGDGED